LPGFLLDEPFPETVRNFPSPDDIIEDWYLTAQEFQNVRDRRKIPDEHREALHRLMGDAVAEHKAAVMLGEAADMERALGAGYQLRHCGRLRNEASNCHTQGLSRLLVQATALRHA
jgi:hypothetical protein